MSKTKKDTIYYVNGEEQSTDRERLTVREILEDAGFTPAEDYRLKSTNPKVDFESRYDEEVAIHPNQRFSARFQGQTPVS
jgi:hypothetical protein